MIKNHLPYLLLIMFVLFIGCERPRKTNEAKVNESDQVQILLSEDDLSGKSIRELRLIRNEIFARHGYKFKSEDLIEHFSQQSWYNPTFDDVTAMLTDVDKKNILTIKTLEIELSNNEAARRASEQLNTERQTLNDSVFKFHNNYVVIPSFEVQLELSKKAEDKLRLSSETVIVDAFFSGIPKDKTNEQYQEWGEISIGEHVIELDTQRIAVFDNATIPRDKFDLLDSKNFQILVNVYSGRRSSQFNILSVDIIQDSVDVVMGKRHVLKGKLIGE